MSSPKTGRNDPCPCGSGKKYKRCCLGQAQPTLPHIVTTDLQEPVLFTTAHFEVKDRAALLEALRQDPYWDVIEEDNEIRAVWLEQPVKEVVYESLDEVDFSTMNRILGQATIQPGTLKLECMSKGRAERGKALLEELAGQALRFKAYSYQSVTSLLRSGPVTPPPESELPPDLQAKLEERYLQHYYEKEWVNAPIPALGGKTPLACKKTKRGREELAWLIRDMESRPGKVYDFARLVAMLGVEKEYGQVEDAFRLSELEEELNLLLEENLRFIRALGACGVDMEEVPREALVRLYEGEHLALQFLAHLEKGHIKEGDRLAVNIQEMGEVFVALQEEILASIPQAEAVVELCYDPEWDHHEGYLVNESDKIITDQMVEGLIERLQMELRREAEKKVVRPNTTLSAVLNKQPALWVEAIHENLGCGMATTKRERTGEIVEYLKEIDNLRAVLQELGPDERSVLSTIYANGGVHSYPTLKRRLGGDEADGYFWLDEPPQSLLGRLRTRGLVFVGRVAKGNRKYSSVVIPKEIMANLEIIFMEG